MLELRNVSFQYNKNKLVLEELNLQFEPGVFYTLFGPSGSGKTTCLSLLGGLDRPTGGQVLLDGKDIEEIGGARLRQQYVTYVFQDFKLFSHMSAIENLLAALAISQPKMDQKTAKSRAVDILEQLGLEKKDMQRPVTRLSGGQMQRVAIGRALLCDTTYILADEPTGNLDSKNTDIIIDLLRKMAREYHKCVIVVTHSLRVRDASDQCYVMEDGRIDHVEYPERDSV